MGGGGGLFKRQEARPGGSPIGKKKFKHRPENVGRGTNLWVLISEGARKKRVKEGKT